MAQINRQSVAFLRYRVLDELFRDITRNYNIDDLVKECNARIKNTTHINESSIRHDIAFMRDEWGMKIVGHGRPVFNYQYEDVDQPCKYLRCFSTDEQNLFGNAIQILSGFNAPQYRWASLFLKMVEQSNGDVNSESCVQFQNNDELKGMEWFSILIESCINKRPLAITYKPYQKNPFTQLVSPYWLKQYNNRWFLICKNIKFTNLSILALDRITGITPSDHKYERCKEDPTIYFRHVIGVTRSDNMKREQFVIKVSRQRIGYIETKPFTDLQTTKELEDGSFLVKFSLFIDEDMNNPKSNKEIIQTLLSFGDDIEVIEPGIIRNQIKQKIMKLSAKYQ